MSVCTQQGPSYHYHCTSPAVLLPGYQHLPPFSLMLQTVTVCAWLLQTVWMQHRLPTCQAIVWDPGISDQASMVVELDFSHFDSWLSAVNKNKENTALMLAFNKACAFCTWGYWKLVFFIDTVCGMNIWSTKWHGGNVQCIIPLKTSMLVSLLAVETWCVCNSTEATSLLWVSCQGQFSDLLVMSVRPDPITSDPCELCAQHIVHKLNESRVWQLNMGVSSSHASGQLFTGVTIATATAWLPASCWTVWSAFLRSPASPMFRNN